MIRLLLTVLLLLSAAASRAETTVRIGAGGELILGGYDPSRRDDPAQAKALDAAAREIRRLGFTSHESYVRWNLCEIAPGRYDWSVYDRYVEVYKRHGLKWVPFLIVGSPYTLPEWYFKSDQQQGYVCLEHGEESHVQSLWNPALRGHVARFLKAFAEHYRDSGVIESVLLGITGNYGEAIYIASGNDWTADVWGQYHTHSGFWAGDPYAVKDFQNRLARQYKSIARLNAAWGADYAAFDRIQPFLPTAEGRNNRAKLDFVNWYIGSMNDWARFWMAETRKHMPKAEIYLCTGGHAPPEHGADFGEQCRIAAEVNGGVRITNEASRYALNFSLTRWVASAGRQYGAYYSFEPAGEVDLGGVVARVYNATASGAKGLHYYEPNIFRSKEATATFETYGPFFQQSDPLLEVAVYYPQTDIKLRGQKFLEPVMELRDRFDFGYMSDNQIRDGGLKSVKALVMLQGTVAEGETWQRIAEWVRRGGLLLYADGIGRLETVEGQEAPLMRVIRGETTLGKGRVVHYRGAPDAAYMDLCAATLARAPELSAPVRAAIAADGKADGVFLAVTQPDTRLWLNTGVQPVTRDGHAIPAHGMGETAATK